MQKLTPCANKANAILIRIVLFLIGGIAIITGMCLFSGDMWMLTRGRNSISPPPAIWWMSSSMNRVNFSSPCSTCLLLPRSGCWRYVKSRRPIQHPILALIILIAAGIVILLHPEVTPGRDASIQYGKHNISYTAIFWSKTNSDRHVTQPSKYEILLKRKIPAGLSTETILAAHGAVKSSGIPSFTPCHSMRAGFRTAIRRSWPASVLR